MELGMFVSWVVVGLLAGWLAGFVMKGGGYGLIGDLGLGLIGSVVGGWIFRALGASASGGSSRRCSSPSPGRSLCSWPSGRSGRTLRDVNLTPRVTRSSLDVVTLHGPGEVYRRRRSV